MDTVVWTPDPTNAALADVLPPAVPGALRALTHALERGDEEAWRQFHATYAPRLFRYLLVVCAGREDASRDALQGTFLRAVRHIRPFDDEAELWGWLTVLARSAAADAGRRERRYLGLLARSFRQRSVPDCELHEAEIRLRSALADELALLPPEERQLLERKYLAGEPVRQLATVLGTTEKAVESRLTRARQRLKSAILARLRHEPSA